ncbi:MAG: MBL fold metallo-hydrolase [Sphingobacteriales bacterium]|nr:MAG: MBL fold metallo-hydrolase [Sphingobacteriales bacterium]
MMIILALITILALAVWLIMSLPVFGKAPKGGRFLRIVQAGNYSSAAFQNRSYTPMKPENISYGQMFYGFLFKRHSDRSPKSNIPTREPNFDGILTPKVTWFGHSTYLLQSDGMNVLVDPVFCRRASPFQFLGSKNFPGTDFFNPDNLPPIDIIVLTHDHYDHLDYNFIKKFKNERTTFITSIGVGAHLEYWGVVPSAVKELNWGESFEPKEGFRFVADTARHFSGRKFKRNQTLWSAFIMLTPSSRYYLGGDSGYDGHFAAAGEQYGPFDLAILECGQYNDMWPHIHMFPEQTAQAAKDLKAKKLMPVHWGKFSLALHAWYEPAERIIVASEQANIQLLIPYLGQTADIGNSGKPVDWWSALK